MWEQCDCTFLISPFTCVLKAQKDWTHQDSNLDSPAFTRPGM